MEDLIEYLEYSARYGLKFANDNPTRAQEIAENKYRQMTGKELSFSEMNDLQHMIEELRHWQFNNQVLSHTTSSAVASQI